MIYFIECQDPHYENGLVKIGYTRTVKSCKLRLTDLQIGCPYPLKLIALVPKGTQRMERELHKAFSDLKVRGEWFKPFPALNRIRQKYPPPQSLAGLRTPHHLSAR